MKVLVLYHPKTEQAGIVADFAKEFKQFKGKKVELVSLETKRGAELAKLYEVDRYPAVLVVAQDGGLQMDWQSLPLPLMDKVSYYQQQPKDQLLPTGDKPKHA